MQTVMANPVVVIKTRLEVIGFNEYNGVFDASRKIYYKEGLPGFFTGLKVSLIRDVPFSGIFYPIYSFFREHLMQLYTYEMSMHHEVTPTERLKAIGVISSVSVMLANICSCTITHPLDLIRTRMYFKQFNNDTTQNYSSIANGFKSIYQTEGFSGFFHGLTPRILRKGFGSIICWTIYEYMIDKKDAVIKIGD